MSAIFFYMPKEKLKEEDLKARGEILREALLSYGSEETYAEVIPGVRPFVMGACIGLFHRCVPAGPPLIRTEKYIAAADAIIYNRSEFSVKGADGMSDGELLLNIYENEGGAGLLRVNGDFAAVCVGRQDGRITLIRDHLGIRPLYMMECSSFLSVASDYRAFFKLPGADGRIDEAAFYRHLTMSGNGPVSRTLFEAVRKVPHGTILTGNPGGISGFYGKRKKDRWSEERFWIPGQRKARKFSRDSEYEEYARKLIMDAVKVRRDALAGADFGAEFSGGLDSGIICSVLDYYAGKEGRPLPPLLTWTPSVRDFPLVEGKDGEEDERPFIREFCQEKGNTCIYRNTEKDTNPEENVRRLEHKDICEYYTGVITAGMEAFAKNGVRAVFSGWGGDEGITMRISPAYLLKTGDWRAFFREAVFFADGSPGKFCRFYKKAFTNLKKAKQTWNAIDGNGFNFSFLNPAFAEKMRASVPPQRYYFGLDPVRNFMTGNLESRTLLAASAGADCGTFYVFPFLDARLVDFSLTVPARLFYSHGEQRVLPRKAMKDFLPGRLSSFIGIGDIAKNDIARMRFSNEAEPKIEKAVMPYLFEKLDRKMFEPYLDFETLASQINAEQDMGEAAAVRVLLTSCYKLQLLAESIPQINDEKAAD